MQQLCSIMYINDFQSSLHVELGNGHAICVILYMLHVSFIFFTWYHTEVPILEPVDHGSTMLSLLHFDSIVFQEFTIESCPSSRSDSHYKTAHNTNTTLVVDKKQWYIGRKCSIKGKRGLGNKWSHLVNKR